MHPALFSCSVSFLSHFGESWNLCSVVGVGINYLTKYALDKNVGSYYNYAEYLIY